MRVLVTGADGFIGGHVANALASAGHETICVVYGRPAGVGEWRIDLASAPECMQLPHDVEAVVHAAGRVDSRGPRGAMRMANVVATKNLLAWAARQGVAHFVQVSSVAVYGPLALGEDIGEDTLRLGLTLGLPYMRTKAWAERAVERSGVPYTLLRPPAVLGRGDTVLSRGFRDALCGAGVPMVPGASSARRVSLALVEGLVDLVGRLLAHGPLYGALHAVDFELTIGELAALYAQALGCACRYEPTSWADALRARHEVGRGWLVASACFGQHYQPARRLTELGYHPRTSLESAIESGLSSLQGRSRGLF